MKTRALELIDFDKIDILLEGFNKTTGFVTAILDLEGNVLSKSGWRQICTEFHRVNQVSAKQCIASDTLLAGKMEEGEVYHFYKCLNGLVDVAVPLVINGEHVANLFSGQFFFEEPDLTYFKKQAKKYGFDEESYLDALAAVPVISEERVRTAMDFLRDMTQLISDLAYQKGALNTLNINIKESEELFKTVFEAANVGKSITLPTGEINVNETFCRMLGYTKEELKNKRWQDLTPPEEIRGIQSQLDQLLEGKKETTRFEKTYICKNGSHIWADVSVFLCRDLEKKPKYFITTIIDISGRKIVEKELSANEEKYRSFFVNSFDAILLTSPDGTIHAANQAACIMFGRTESEIIKGGRNSLVDASDPRLPLLLAERGNKGRAKGELTFLRADGTKFQAEVSSAIYADSQGMPRTVMIISDITERIKSREDLRISEEKYLKIFQASPDIIILTSLDEGIIVDVNERLEAMTGYSRGEILGKKTLALDFWVEPAERDKYIASLLKDGKVRDLEVKFRVKSGEIRDTLLSGEIINLHSGRHILGVIRDITEQKQAEAEKNKFVMLADSSSEFIGMCDLEMNPVYVNPAGIKMVGLADLKAACSIKVQDYFYPEDQAFVRDEFFPGVLRVGHGDVEIRLRHFRTGEPIWMYYYLFHVRDSNGTLIGWATVSRDITERKKIMEALAESEERLRQSTEMANIAVWEYDFLTNSMSRSRNHDKLYGLDWQPLWNIETFLNATHPDDREFSDRIIKRSVTPGGPDDYRFEFRVVYPDGSVHWLDVTGKVISRNEKGEGIIVRGALIDISHLKKIQELLYASEQKFETLFRSAAMPVILTRLADNIIVDVNEAWLRLFEYVREEVVGRKLQDLGYFKNRGDEKVSAAKPLKNETLTEGEFTLLRKSGSPVEVITSTNVVEIDGNEYRLTSIYNITDRKIAEEKLARQTRLYSVLSKINELLVRERDPEHLFYEVCKIIVTYGGFRMAWIGILGKDSLKVNPAAFYGHEDGYLGMKLFSGDSQTDTGSGPTGKTIRSGSYYVCNDISSDPAMMPWRDEALKRGYRSSLAVAIRQAGQVTGTLNLYSETTGFFDHSEIKLLNTLAENISYTLDSIEYAEELKKSREELRELAIHIESIRENERKSIAMNLHDDLGQKLTAIKMDLNRFRLRAINSDRDMENRVSGMMDLIDDTVKTVQKISSDLRPAILYDLGLKEAVEWQMREFSGSSGIKCRINIHPEEFKLEEKISVTVFRILQEALTNVARHSSATEVKLNLKVTESKIILLLADNGEGIEPEKLRSHKSFGLISMRERAEALSGKIEIKGIRHKGTEVKLEIPVTR